MRLSLIILIILFLGALLACTQTNRQLNYRSTLHIDTAELHNIEKKFNISCVKAPEYLGGLTPNYAIVKGIQILFLPGGNFITKDTGWVTGGLLPQARKIIVKINKDYVAINNRKELQQMYAPISSEEEALAYGILYQQGFAIFDDFYKKGNYRFVGNRQISKAERVENGFIVNIFSHRSFGCSHPYYLQVLRVGEDGEVKLISQKESFYDPKEDGLCVD